MTPASLSCLDGWCAYCFSKTEAAFHYKGDFFLAVDQNVICQGAEGIFGEIADADLPAADKAVEYSG